MTDRQYKTPLMIRQTAKELAGAFYEGNDVLHDGRATRSARFRRAVSNDKAFVWVYWPKFVPLARKILAHMLTEPNRPQHEKDAIFDALVREQGHAPDDDGVNMSPILSSDGQPLIKVMH